MGDPFPAHWRAVEDACRTWTKTRERPHPPMPGVVRYVVKAGTPVWTGDGMATLRADVILDWPPTKEAYPGAEWNALRGRWERGGSVAYHVEPVDLALYEHLYRAGLLDPPPAEAIDNRKAPGA